MARDARTRVTTPKGNGVKPPDRSILYGILAIGVLTAIAMPLIFPNLRYNPGYLALVLLTPLLVATDVGLTRSGFRSKIPRPSLVALRSLLYLVIVLDLIVFLLPVFVSGATAHDAAPAFTVSTHTRPTTTTTQTTTPTPPLPPQVRSGAFDHRPVGDTVSGKAILGETSNGQLVLRLEQLNATHGPDLYVYLSAVASPSTRDQVMSGLEVGKLKATSGDLNYILSPSLDIAKYKSVVIYCKSFSVIFGFASLA